MGFFRTFAFIAMLAAMMGLSALGIDAVLPAFQAISQEFDLTGTRENDIQQMVYLFMLGFAIMQLLFGVMADFLGRKVLLITGILVFVAASVASIFISSFEGLLIARFIQGAGLAAPRVLSQTVVRDIASGRAMSRIMSFAMMVFLLVPILAPTVGQFMLTLGNWHTIFYLFAGLGLALAVWVSVQLPETLPKHHRRKPTLSNITDALKTCFIHRPTLVYMIMLCLLFTMMMTYIGLSEQIYGRDVYQLGAKFPLAFAATAMGMVFAAFVNARIVVRVGMRQIIFWALIFMLINDLVLVGVSLLNHGKPPLWFFMPSLIVHLFCFGMSMPNLNSLVLEPHGKIAGTVAAVVGTLMTIAGVILAFFIARQFNNNVYPLAIGWFTLSLLANCANLYVIRYQQRALPGS